MTMAVYIDFYHTKYARAVHFISMFPFSPAELFPFRTFSILFSCEKCFVCVLFFHFCFSHSLPITDLFWEVIFIVPNIVHETRFTKTTIQWIFHVFLNLNSSHFVQLHSAQNSTCEVVFSACKIFIYQFLLYKETPFYFFPMSDDARTDRTQILRTAYHYDVRSTHKCHGICSSIAQLVSLQLYKYMCCIAVLIMKSNGPFLFLFHFNPVHCIFSILLNY